jgi:selenocysteine-specific elongation factor
VLAGLGPEFTLSSARQALRTSRRVAVPLLELLARLGHTQRTPDGNHRLVTPR